MFESLNNIEGLSDDHKKQIEEILSPKISEEIKSTTGKTFSEIDEFVQEFTGVKKEHGQFTSKFLKEALPLWKDSFEVDSKKRISESWEQEKAGYLKQLEKAKDSDKIFNDYQSAVKANEELQILHKQQLDELKNDYETKIRFSSISSQLPSKLNTPLLAPWKERVAQMMIETGAEIENGKVKASEATGGLAMDIDKFIVKNIPELKEAFQDNSNSLSVNNDAGKKRDILISDVKSVQELDALLRDKVCTENGIDRTHAKFSQLFREERLKHKEIIESLQNRG